MIIYQLLSFKLNFLSEKNIFNLPIMFLKVFIKIKSKTITSRTHILSLKPKKNFNFRFFQLLELVIKPFFGLNFKILCEIPLTLVYVLIK